jgi:hypothetical protein
MSFCLTWEPLRLISSAASSRWRIRESAQGRELRRWELLDDSGLEITFEQVVGEWRSNEAFRSFWHSSLGNLELDTYCWECPPVTKLNFSRAFECVFMSSPLLARMAPDPDAFSEHFLPGCGVAIFDSLGNDARLVAPCPDSPGVNYAHLAAFVASAAQAQASALWQAVGEAMDKRIQASPIWLSTAGLGVAWLHVRLDSRPKYYGHAPYRDQFFR